MARHLSLEHTEVDLMDPAMRIASKAFKMKIYKKFKYPMDRQICEAIKIARAGGLGAPNLMNAKEEYSRCVIPQIEMAKGPGGTKFNNNSNATTTGKRLREEDAQHHQQARKRQRREVETTRTTPSLKKSNNKTSEDNNIKESPNNNTGHPEEKEKDVGNTEKNID